MEGNQYHQNILHPLRERKVPVPYIEEMGKLQDRLSYIQKEQMSYLVNNDEQKNIGLYNKKVRSNLEFLTLQPIPETISVSTSQELNPNNIFSTRRVDNEVIIDDTQIEKIPPMNRIMSERIQEFDLETDPLTVHLPGKQF
jgi:hypothetical protein